MISPELICDKHLLGEHYEIHMIAGSLNKGRKVIGYLDKELIEPQSLQKRHQELVNEFHQRGFKHKSELMNINTDLIGIVNEDKSLFDLENRCINCRKRICFLGRKWK